MHNDRYIEDIFRKINVTIKDISTKSHIESTEIEITWRERGVAYDHLCIQLDEYSTPISEEFYNAREALGRILQIEIKYFEKLMLLIKNQKRFVQTSLEIKTRVQKLLNEVKDKLLESDISHLETCITAGEWQIAYEDLCTQVYEYSIPLSQKTYDEFEETGRFMNVKNDYWNCLKSLISNLSKKF